MQHAPVLTEEVSHKKVSYEGYCNPQYTESHQTTQTKLCGKLHLNFPEDQDGVGGKGKV